MAISVKLSLLFHQVMLIFVRVESPFKKNWAKVASKGCFRGKELCQQSVRKMISLAKEEYLVRISCCQLLFLSFFKGVASEAQVIKSTRRAHLFSSTPPPPTHTHKSLFFHLPCPTTSCAIWVINVPPAENKHIAERCLL